MFESVQLNINNPNFMIMQGKITKVVNMKPKETLIMIEECVGATIYKAKRDKAVAEMGEKQKQIKEIEDVSFNFQFPPLHFFNHYFSFVILCNTDNEKCGSASDNEAERSPPDVS